MALFKKKTTKEPPLETVQEAPPERKVQQTSLQSGRMAAVFLRMYRWIFSVSLSRDVYQIESGKDECGGEALPIRGYYHALLETLSRFVIEEQRAQFAECFSKESIARAAKEHSSSISAVFCADFDTPAAAAVEPSEDTPTAEPSEDMPAAEPQLAWYEVRAELLKDSNPGNLLFVFYIRPIRDDLDNGRAGLSVNLAAAESAEDWNRLRTERLLGSSDTIKFEYDVVNDVMYLHRSNDPEQGDRVTKDYLRILNSRSDWVVNHESVPLVKKMLRADPGRDVDTCEILYRKGGSIGAPFRHYRLTAVPLEEQGAPTWILGMLEDVEERFQHVRQSEEITMELGQILKMYQITLYEIRPQSNQLFDITQDEHGFRLDATPRNLKEYITRSIESGTIAPESAALYRDWLSPSAISKRTARGAWEYESRLRPPGATEYRWYAESILPLGKTGGRFIRWRSDITDAHEAREKEFEFKEMAHVAEYNAAILDSMAGLVEFRNIESGHHIRNVRELTRILFNDVIRRSPQYDVPPNVIRMYVQAASMHDIGKITIPDHVLNKAGKYTPEEYELMKQHTVQGALIIDRIDMPPGLEELKAIIRDVALHHHERYDGKGYPDGLAGDAIPIGVQVVSISDVFDALVSERCYKLSYPVEEALRIIMEGEAGAFNPALLESLRACVDQLTALYTDLKGEADG